MNDFTSADSLIRGYKRAVKSSGWKEATQKFGLNLMREVFALQDELRNGTYKQSAGARFVLNEQGKRRLISALSVRDAVMQHSLCDSVLIPELSRYMIHDNGASLKGKGISFTRRRFEEHLRWHYRRYGREGYILKIDFRKYFDNIRHDVLLKAVGEKINDEVVMNTIRTVLKANEHDVGFVPDVEPDDVLFNSLEHYDPARSPYDRTMHIRKSIAIGAPLAQIAGIYLPTRIDTWCKHVRQVHCYDTYMDDRIIIHPDKEFLKELLCEVEDICRELGIVINRRKTQIIKLRKGFTFLKTRYILTESGKIIRRIPKDVVARQRRKMKKLAALVADGEITLADFENQYKGWRGDKNRYHARRTLINIDKLFKELKDYGKREAGNHQRKETGNHQPHE